MLSYMPVQVLNDSDHWREGAKEIRLVAEQMPYPDECVKIVGQGGAPRHARLEAAACEPSFEPEEPVRPLDAPLCVLEPFPSQLGGNASHKGLPF